MCPAPITASDHDASTSNLAPRALLLAARGFSCMFWGIPLSLFFMVGALRIELAIPIRLPAYFFGVLVLYVGFFSLYRAAPDASWWRRCSLTGLVLSFVLVYFTPFVYWWRQSPLTPFFLYNMMALLIVCAGVLYAVNRLSAEIARLLRDPVLAVEARMCAWSALLVLVPILALVLGFALHAGTWSDATWIAEYIHRRRQPPTWMFFCFLLPVALTMTSSWKAKERCLVALLKSTIAP